MNKKFPIEGGCDCRHIRYQMTTEPLIVHCCHCTWCQRESGSAFALNASIESDRVKILSGSPELIDTPSASGAGQQIARCPNCYVAVWSHYSGSGHLTKYVKVGTLDDPTLLPPDVHIFTSTKQPWVIIPEEMLSFDGYYSRREVWRPESQTRLEALWPQIEAYRAALKSSE